MSSHEDCPVCHGRMEITVKEQRGYDEDVYTDIPCPGIASSPTEFLNPEEVKELYARCVNAALDHIRKQKT